MEYTVNHLAKLSGVSTRTLRYYDKIGLLKPLRISSNGYRIYGEVQIDLLQQILFYRALDFSLEEIKSILSSPDFDRTQALKSHLASLETRKMQIELLIGNVKKTISSMKGEVKMTDQEKFEGLKEKLIQENEAAYGSELRKEYGDDTIDASNAKLAGMTEAAWAEAKSLEERIGTLLAESIRTDDPASPTAQEMCALHRTWLTMFWPDGTCSEEAHLALADGYVADERFRAYYDNIADGGAEFLRDALRKYYSK